MDLEEKLQQCINMLSASLDSRVLTDDDRLELFELMLGQVSGREALQLIPTLVYFSDKLPALYADAIRRYTELHPNDCIELLLRQLDDPQVDDESVGRSILTVVEKLQFGLDQIPLSFALVLPIVYDLRPQALAISTIGLHFDDLQNLIGPDD